MKKATQPDKKAHPSIADSFYSALHTVALQYLFSLLLALAVLGCIWLVEVLA